MSDEQILSAFKLYKDNLITKDIFYETIEKIRAGSQKSFVAEITQGQVNYIKRLQSEGKIPKNQSLLITKQEAQILIHNAINMPNKTECVTDKNTPNEQAQTGSAAQDLYSEERMYM